MALVCDRCERKALLYDFVIRGKKYQVCKDCLNEIIAFIKNKKPQNFLEKLGEQFYDGKQKIY